MFERLKSVSPLFAAVVLLPTLLAALYFGLLANDIYVSETRFIVRSPGKTSLSPLSAVLGGESLTGSSEESEAVTEFLQSRDALAQINEDGFVRDAYSNSGVFFLDRFGGIFGDSNEELYQYFSGMLAVETGASASITRLQVRAYDPQQAQEIAERLLSQSELLVNALSDRSRSDAIAFAEEQAEEAREEARSAALELANYRDQQGIIDPELQAEASLQMVSKLQDQLIAARTQLLQMRTYTPEASQIPFLETQVRELEQEVASQTASIAGGRRSLSSASARYQELLVASQFAEQQLTVAMAGLQEAQAESRRKQAYLDRISEPSLSDDAAYPRRIRNILATFVLGLLAWGVLSMLITGIREHRD